MKVLFWLFILTIIASEGFAILTPATKKRDEHVSTENANLKVIGKLVYGMVETLAKDGDKREIDLAGLSNLVGAVVKGAQKLENPAQYESLQNQDKRIKDMESKIYKRLHELESDNKQFREEIKQKVSAKQNLTEFQATFTTSLRTQSTLKYNNIITNQGNFYDTYTGKFTCIEGGRFFVSLTFNIQDPDHIYYSTISYSKVRKTSELVLKLKVGDNIVTNITGIGNGGSASGSVIVECAEGEMIWVESLPRYAHGTVSNAMIHIYEI